MQVLRVKMDDTEPEDSHILSNQAYSRIIILAAKKSIFLCPGCGL